MNIRCLKRVVLCGAITCILVNPVRADLISYWPLNEAAGAFTAPNAVVGGTDASLFGAAQFVTDAVRGQVLQFDGSAGTYANAGALPELTIDSDFTWSFWARNEEVAGTPVNHTILGNRYNFDNVDYNPREFIKFTPQAFEFHHDGIGENVDYPDVPISQWVHMSVVKDGNTFYSFRNGLLNGVRTITATPINGQPLFFGGDRNVENWNGALDDVALWTDALPLSSITGIATGKYTPANAPRTASAPAYVPVFSENFSAGLEGKWNVTNRGLENNADAGYLEPNVEGGDLSLGGATGQQYWYGKSIESVQEFDSKIQTKVSVDRLSLEGSGSAFRSSLWILGDDTHYLHFSQNVGEGGWSWNANDGAGVGTLLPTGSGNNIASLDSLDTDFGNHKMTLEVVPTGALGDVNILIYLDDVLVAGQGFSDFPDTFQVVLTGQARAAGDTVDAVFDNLLVQQVPEPSTAAMLLGMAVVGLGRRRRK